MDAPDNLNIGVRVKHSGLLVGFIHGHIAKHQINKNIIDTVEINFLCVHPKLRHKRLTTVLIKEISRLYQLRGFSHAFYMTDRYLPKPFSTVDYYYRPLNVHTLLKTGFLHLEDKTTENDLAKFYKILNKPHNKNFVKMCDIHLESAYEILAKYLQKYNFHPIFSRKKFDHLFHNNDFITTYVLEDDNKTVLDLISYYKVQSNVSKNSMTQKLIKTANLFYYTSFEETPYRLVHDILVIAKNEGIDLFSALNVMENNDILQELNFTIGTKKFHYYFWNWKCRDLNKTQIGKIAI
jgi:glycylpeptide N-tetradecanoyltransferase